MAKYTGISGTKEISPTGRDSIVVGKDQLSDSSFFICVMCYQWQVYVTSPASIARGKKVKENVPKR